MTGEWSRYYRQAALHDLDVLHERFVKHWFARHSHEFWVIGVVEAGVQAFSYRGARHVTLAGQVFLVNPGEPHTGEPATSDGYVYRTVYPRPELMLQVAAEVTDRTALPFSRVRSFVMRACVNASLDFIAQWPKAHRPCQSNRS